MRLMLSLFVMCVLFVSTSQAGMRMGEWGMVMNENHKELPQGCSKIEGVQEIIIKAGREYAKPFPGTVFGYSQHEFNLPICTQINVTFINEDDIRHQFMIHGLPTYLHPQGMFHMELYGRGEVKGSFISPAEDITYLAHCDIAQHMEKGMKAQVKVGDGNGELPSIPGLTGQLNLDEYDLDLSLANMALVAMLLLLGAAIFFFFFIGRSKKP